MGYCCSNLAEGHDPQSFHKTRFNSNAGNGVGIVVGCFGNGGRNMTRAFMLRYTCETCGRIWVGDGKKTIQDYCNHVDVCEQGKKVIHQELVREEG